MGHLIATCDSQFSMIKYFIPYNEMKLCVLSNEPISCILDWDAINPYENPLNYKKVWLISFTIPHPSPPFLKCCIYKNNFNMAQKWDSQGKA